MSKKKEKNLPQDAEEAWLMDKENQNRKRGKRGRKRKKKR